MRNKENIKRNINIYFNLFSAASVEVRNAKVTTSKGPDSIQDQGTIAKKIYICGDEGNLIIGKFPKLTKANEQKKASLNWIKNGNRRICLSAELTTARGYFRDNSESRSFANAFSCWNLFELKFSLRHLAKWELE